MKEYFNSVGFKNIITKNQLKSLKDSILDFPTERYFSSTAEGNNYFEYYKKYGSNIGLSIKGIIDELDKITISSFIPYAKSKSYINVDFINIEKNESENEYYIICEDIETNNEIIFYLQNVYEYLKFENKKIEAFKKASISGLSSNGKIILPVKKDDDIIKYDYRELQQRKEMIKKAKLGDDDAAQQLEMEEEENAEIIQNRLKNEDFLSVIESYIIPSKSSDIIYSVLGDIIEIEKLNNENTEQTIYRMFVDITGTKLDIFINSDDLIGHPTIGMRLMCECCFQGFIY